MVDKVVKHIDVGEEIDGAEWVSEELHDLPADTVLIIGKAPSGFYKVYELYMKKIGDRYFPVFVHNDTPEE